MPLAAYALAASVLFLKFAGTASIQGIVRLRTKSFQYPEDAAYWRGEERAVEPDLVVRAQRLLRNDAEGQPLFLALGGAYVALGATPWAAPVYFGAYVLARLVHAWFMLRPRQPHRNRAFGLGLAALLALTAHTTVAALQRLAG